MAPRAEELLAPPGWRTIDFISDLHLQPAEAATVRAWRDYLASTPAQAVFILGDLFEAWPGDDDLAEPGFSADCAAALRQAGATRDLFVMHGNRDFLLGDGFARATGARLLADPTVLAFAGRRWLLSHGDALCLGDTEYMQFRARARDPAWQRELLARPLAERRALAVTLRAQSEDRKRSGAVYADVDAAEAARWLQAAGADVLVHGHTHKPGEHEVAPGLRRIVLSDWDLAARRPRAEVLRLTAEGVRRVPLA